jgi:hypothetical protein
MANTDAPQGLVPIRSRFSSAAWTGGGNMYSVASSNSTSIGIGDPVVITGTADSTYGVATVVRATAGGTNTISGVMVGRVYVTRDSTPFVPASTAAYILVCDDPNMIYEAQEDSVGGNIALTSVGQGVDFIVTADCNTTNGNSNVELDSSTAGSGTQLQIIALSQVVGNAVGTNAKWWVVPRRSTWANAISSLI